MNLRNFFLAAGIAAVAVPVWGQKAPEPYGLTPSARQVEWYNREMIAFFHFGINTFEEYVNEGRTCSGSYIQSYGPRLRTVDAYPSVGRYP